MMQLPKMLKTGMQRLRLDADWQEQFQTDASAPFDGPLNGAGLAGRQAASARWH